MDHKFLNARCEIKTMNNDLLLVGVVTKVEPERIYLGSSNPDRDAFLPTLPYGIRVKAVMYKEDMGTRVVTGNVYLSGDDMMCLGGVELLTAYEKRNYFRVNVSMKTIINREVTREDAENEADHAAQEVEIETLPVNIIDLSLGGVSFRSDVLLNPHDSLEIILHFENKTIPFFCTVRRVMPDEEKGDNVYGCSFEKVSNKMSTDLCAFLFLQQKLQIKKSKESAFMAGGM